jgi:hypothetical protein
VATSQFSADAALVAQDSLLINELLCAKPGPQQMVDAARLIQRYRHNPNLPDLQQQLKRVLSNWSMNVEELFAITRKLWASGEAAGDPARRTADALLATPVGSGNDLEG